MGRIRVPRVAWRVAGSRRHLEESSGLSKVCLVRILLLLTEGGLAGVGVEFREFANQGTVGGFDRHCLLKLRQSFFVLPNVGEEVREVA